MEAIRQDHPPAYDHNPESLILPSVPNHSLPPHAPITLPDLKSLKLPTGRPTPPSLQPHPQWQFSHPNYRPPIQSAGFPSTLPPPSPMETESVMSEPSRLRAHSIMSLDDPETREAAETLSGLRNMDFHRPKPSSSINNMAIRPLSMRDDKSVYLSDVTMEDEPEPLLELITSSHPWVGGTINTSLYAYNTTMHYSPAFISSFVSRNMTTVGNGIGTISRATGVESRVRQYFGDTPERQNARASYKRGREHSPGIDDIERGLSSSEHSKYRSRTSSQASFAESLPAYDENRAPDYEQKPPNMTLQQSHAWSTRMMITTGGLGVALSHKSLRSLKYCLNFLRQASEHLAEIMAALRNLIAEAEQYSFGAREGAQPGYTLNPQQEATARSIAENIKKLGTDIMSTLQVVTDNVSKYTGGTLPENAGALVRRQLMSVPQRWRIAQESTATPAGASQQGESEAMRVGQRLFAFAEQGCDMITQVGLVLSGTVDSAEKWLDSMGSRRASVAGTATSEKTVVMSPPSFDMSDKR